MPQTTEDILRIIKESNADVLSEMLNNLIKEHRREKGDREQTLYKRYIQDKDAVPILTRRKANPMKINEKLGNDFFGDIVDTKTGYMGNEISVELKKDNYYKEEPDEETGEPHDVLNEDDYDVDTQKLKDFSIRNDTEDTNSEAIKLAAICGWCPRLLYIKLGDTEPRLMNLNPWEVIVVYDSSIHEPEAVIRYYEMEKVSYEREAPFDEEKRKLIYLEWYDEQYITYYIGEKETKHTDKYTFRLDVERIPGGRQKHLFSGIPVIPLLNNEESQAEAEKAISLIDAYDTILSDTTSEIEQLRLAYLWVKNMGSNITDKFLERVEQTGVFPLQENGEVGFAQKVLDDAVIQNTLAEIRQNIYQFSKSIDLTKDMGGDMRVIGWQVNLLNLENSCKVTERKFIKGLREQYRMLTEFWRRFKNGVEIEYLDLEFVFNRNFPKNIADEAKTLIDLLSSVSRKTAYGLMSFIDDADKEVAAWEEEKEKNSPLVDLDEIMGEEDEEEEEEEAE